jgi:hypothetical protein
MWQKAATAAGYTIAAEPPRPEKVAARIPLPIPRPPFASDITGSIARMR